MMQKSSTMSNYYKIRVSLHSAQAPIPLGARLRCEDSHYHIVRTSDITMENESPSQSEPSPERACSLFTKIHHLLELRVKLLSPRDTSCPIYDHHYHYESIQQKDSSYHFAVGNHSSIIVHHQNSL